MRSVTNIALSILAAKGAVAQLNTAAKAAGKLYFGTAVDNGDLSDATYVTTEANTGDFGQITPTNTMKWDSIEPSQNTFSFSGGDTIANLAKKNGQLLRCHNLVWYNQLPSWVSSGTWTNATLVAALKNHIVNEVTHYKGQCYAWDVVNEALNDDGTWRTDVFYNIIGKQYIPIAFATAAATDPSAKLYYNDYNIETASAKSTSAQQIVQLVQSQGIKIDGVGLQSHFIVGETPSTSAQASNMAAFTKLGVDVAITELDVRMTLPSTAALLAQQSTDYATTVNACLQTARCVGITLWDFTDKYSWVPSTFSGQGAALPWDASYNKKPCYTGILNALKAAATGGTPPPPPPPVSSTTIVVSVPPKTSTAVVARPSSTSKATTGGTVPEYGQCGGIGWTGATACASPWTCKVLNAYYSQCL
ncbi:hypothetical protein MMC25_000618 [Agyrium rufum]|nr:hypothetical protein [Agyrium rufum]